MREIKLKIDKRLDVRQSFRTFLMNNKVEEYYEKKFVEGSQTLYVFSYETSFIKAIWGNKTPVRIFVTTTLIASINDNLTELSIVESSDIKNDSINPLVLYFKDLGFKSA